MPLMFLDANKIPTQCESLSVCYLHPLLSKLQKIIKPTGLVKVFNTSVKNTLLPFSVSPLLPLSNYTLLSLVQHTDSPTIDINNRLKIYLMPLLTNKRCSTKID